MVAGNTISSNTPTQSEFRLFLLSALLESNLVYKCSEFIIGKGFDKPVRSHIVGGYPFECDCSCFHLIPYEMPLNVNVLNA